MTRIDRFAWVSLWVALTALGTSQAPLWAATPMEQVKATGDRVMEILRNPSLKGEDNKNARREQLRQAILPRFDFTEMAKRSLGSHWNRNPQKQREFVSAFSRLLEDGYADQIEAANGNRIVYLKERKENNVAEVATKVISPKGEDTSISYKLHLAGKEWKVHDVVVENISLVNNYRSQFDRALATAAIEELIRKMKDKKLERNS